MAKPSPLRCYSWNVNGIRAVEKKGFLDWLIPLEADVVFLQETKAQPDQLSEALLAPKGWHAHYHSAQRKGYSSVAAFTRKKPSEVFYGCGVKKYDLEGRAIGVRFGKRMAWGCYFPNGQHDLGRVPYKLGFYKAFLTLMNRQRREGLQLLVSGDLNTAHREIDLARPKPNRKNTGFLPIECAELQRWLDSGWIDTFRHVHGDAPDHYTWWSFRSNARARNIGWRLDYFLADEALGPRISDARIHPDVMGSDHCPVSVTLD